MKIALFYVFSCAIVASSRAQACGRELLAYDFDDHPGEYSKWTMSDMEKAWPKLDARPDFRGDMQKPGLVYSEGIERARVGKQNLRLFMPKVIILDLAICWSIFRYLSPTFRYLGFRYVSVVDSSLLVGMSLSFSITESCHIV